jgi:hypothetical protein
MTEPTRHKIVQGRHFDQEIIILCARWYITFKLSFRDLVQMMAERGISLSHTTILRRVQHVPEFESAGTITHGQSVTPGVWMRLTSRSKVSGSTSIAPWIGSHLECTGGKFVGSEEFFALNAAAAKIDGFVFLNSDFHKEDKKDFSAEEGVTFASATIGRDLDCEGGHLASKGNRPALDAQSAMIAGSVYFRSGTSAEGGVTFASATIGRDLYCEGRRLASKWYGTAFDAQSAKIAGSVHLLDMDGEVKFNFATVASDFQWTPVKSREHALLDLQHVKVGSILMQLNKSLSLDDITTDGFVYDQIDGLSSANSSNPLRWIRLQPHDTFLPQRYEQLSSVLRAMGFQEDAVKVMIAKNDEAGEFAVTEASNAVGKDLSKRRYLKGSGDLLMEFWYIFWYWFFGKFIGYGYTPWHALYASLAIVVIGYFVFKAAYKAKIIIPKDDGISLRQLVETYPKFNACIYSLETFVPLVKLGVGDYWIPNAHGGAELRLGRFALFKAGSLFRLYFWIHILTGWVLTTLWVGGFTGLIKS